MSDVRSWKVGARVRVCDQLCNEHGRTGTVVQYVELFDIYHVRIDLDDQPVTPVFKAEWLEEE